MLLDEKEDYTIHLSNHCILCQCLQWCSHQTEQNFNSEWGAYFFHWNKGVYVRNGGSYSEWGGYIIIGIEVLINKPTVKGSVLLERGRLLEGGRQIESLQYALNKQNNQ